MTRLAEYAARIEANARRLGLSYSGVDFELVPERFMMETAVYGLPVRMPHWSFGVRYIRQLVQRNMGHSRIFEVMFPGDPCKAYLVDVNSLAENVLVVAHVLGHADFAHRIDSALAKHGQERVEAVLDAALALEAHIDVNRPLYRTRAGEDGDQSPPIDADPFRRRWETLPGEQAAEPSAAPAQRAVPAHPVYDLLWFIAHYGPELEDWERDAFLAVREESFYFYPVFACQIMNEGWASYWHARLLREADLLPSDLYVSAIKTHSDVVQPHAAGKSLALAVNPYHLGFSIWERIVERLGLDTARRICAEEDDFGFVRNHLDQELADQLELFVYEASADGAISVASRDIHAVREAILAPRFNFGVPRVAATKLDVDGSLTLAHDHRSDGRGLDLKRAERVLEYVVRVWRRPVSLQTVDEHGASRVLSARPHH